MFQSRATVIDFLGDKDKYPCHHGHKIGDEFIFDGERFIGTICPSLAPLVVPRMIDLHAAGPRYRDSIYYFPFLYSPVSVEDPALKKYDGAGYRNVLETYTEPRYHVANLASSGFKWPPPEERTVRQDITVICPDYRTSVKVKLDAFDLSDRGRNIPYYRREMVILQKIRQKPGIEIDKILDEFTQEQIEGIYPALSRIMVRILVEELELMSYVTVSEGKVTVTRKGDVKLVNFKAGLSEEEKQALGI